MNIIEKIVDFLKKLSGMNEIRLTDDLKTDVGLDSLNMVILLVELEVMFLIELDESDMNPLKLKTVRDVINLVEKYI